MEVPEVPPVAVFPARLSSRISSPVRGGGGYVGPAGHGFVHQVVEAPSIPGEVPEIKVPPHLERTSTGLSIISKVSSLPQAPGTGIPVLERSGTGLSSISKGRLESKTHKAQLERSGTGLSKATGISKASSASTSKKTRFLEDPETENISTEEMEESESESESSQRSDASSDLRSGKPEPTAPASKPMLMGGDSQEPSNLMKLALLQQFKAEFLQSVKSRRHEVSVPAATGILREVPFFREFDDVLSGTIFHLAKLSLLQDAEEGEVLFRQGDDPVDCYIVSRGSVGVYIRKDPQTSLREFNEEHVQVIQVKKAPRCQLPCFRRQQDEFDLEFGVTDRHYTLEGFNTYSASSELGTSVVVLQRGAAFGELGLMERKPRAASIRCESKCTFLVVRRNAFQRWFSESISADVYRKRLFFITKIPGFSEETLRNSTKQASMSSISDSTDTSRPTTSEHVVDRFKALDLQEGHVVLKEGVIEDPVIYIIRSGHLDILRQSRRPHSAGTSQAKMQSKRPVSAGRKGAPPISLEREVHFGRLSTHAMFCSLSTLGLQYPEEFSLKVSSKVCSVFMAKEDDLEALPERVVKPLLVHIRQALRPLLCYSGAYQCLDQLILEDTKEEDSGINLL